MLAAECAVATSSVGVDAELVVVALEHRHEDLRRVLIRRAAALRGLPRLLRVERPCASAPVSESARKADGQCRVALR